ncbi:MAG TPA: hypothetical protein VFF71_05220 [Luteimonas sp.]|nr:hypothetical protein [Luteimonas sp.]
MTRLLLPSALAIALACSACGPAPEDPARRAAVQSGPDAPATPSPAAPAADKAVDTPGDGSPGDGEVGYACDDGSRLAVAWLDGYARIRLPDGRTVTLPRAESASDGEDDVFVGSEIGLERQDKGDTVILSTGAEERLQCHPDKAAE